MNHLIKNLTLFFIILWSFPSFILPLSFINNQDKYIHTAIGERIKISWLIGKYKEFYKFSNVLLRMKDEVLILGQLNKEEVNTFISNIDVNIVSFTQTNIELLINDVKFDGAIFSIENYHKRNNQNFSVDVYDNIPIVIVDIKSLNCYDKVKYNIENQNMNISCTVFSNIEPDIQVIYKKEIPIFYVFKTKSVDNSSYAITIQIEGIELVLKTDILVSASVGNYMKNYLIHISEDIAPINTLLTVNGNSYNSQYFKLYEIKKSEIIIKCISFSYSDVTYSIKGPTKKYNYNLIKLSIDNDYNQIFGNWECTSKNKYGQQSSNKIFIEKYSGVPEIPLILVDGIESKNNSFYITENSLIKIKCIAKAYPLISNYYLEKINTGANLPIIVDPLGEFNLHNQFEFSDNIYTCQASNEVGNSTRAIFHLFTLNENKINLYNPLQFELYFLISISLLSSFLFLMIIILIVKLYHSKMASKIIFDLFIFKRNNKFNNSVFKGDEMQIPLLDNHENSF